MTHRFFRSSPEVYEQCRLALDSAFGYPNDFAKTCFAPAPDGVAVAGVMYLGIRQDFCNHPTAGPFLSQVIASGDVQEIDEATYKAAADSVVPAWMA
jgi:hypothetical protein